MAGTSFDPAGSDRILDAALAQFAQRGYENTTLEAVGAAAGIDRPSLELMFPTKARLFGVLVNRELERLCRQVIDAVPIDGGEATVGEAVGSALADLLALVRGHAMSWRLIMHADFGSFEECQAKDEVREVLSTRLRWLVASTAPVGGPDRRRASALMGRMLAALLELNIELVVNGVPTTLPAEVVEGLDALFAGG